MDREELRAKLFGGNKEQSSVSPTVNAGLLKLFSPQRLERIKKKALRRYKAKQDAQYERWLEAVSK